MSLARDMSFAGHQLSGCKQCGGVFARAETLSTLYARRLDHALVAALDAFSAGKPEPEPGAQKVELDCPECLAPMSPQLVQDAAVWVNVCREHGTWFDAWELPRVLRAVAARPAPAAPPSQMELAVRRDDIERTLDRARAPSKSTAGIGVSMTAASGLLYVLATAVKDSFSAGGFVAVTIALLALGVAGIVIAVRAFNRGRE
jgi:hypothetical protein